MQGLEQSHMFVAMRNAVHCCHVLSASAKDVSRREGFRGIPAPRVVAPGVETAEQKTDKHIKAKENDVIQKEAREHPIDAVRIEEFVIQEDQHDNKRWNRKK